VSYRVLARTWRPQSFDDLLGQTAVVRTLRNAIESQTMAHAYLFSGLRGVGKTTAARLFARAVNCVRGPTPDPCGECVSCVEIAAGSSLDVVELDAATHTGVDDVRDLQELLRFRPSRDRFRVVIVDEVHMLSKSAFNALLKSIEEPPPYVLWVFATTERHKVPATILSRCQQLEFRPIGVDLIAEHIARIAEAEEITVSRGAAETIARAAEGSVRDALSLLDQLRAFAEDRIDDDAVATVLGVPRFEIVMELVATLADGRAGDALEIIRGVLSGGHDATVLFQEVGRVLRWLAHLAADPGFEPALNDDQIARLSEFAGHLGADALIRMLGLWLDQESMVRDAANRELAVEVAALRLTRWPTVQRLEQMLARDAGVAHPSGGLPPASGQAAPVAGGPATAPETGGGPPSSARSRLARPLWDDSPQLAGAVESAEVRLEGSAVILRFPASAQPLARFVSSEDARQRLMAACQSVFGSDKVLRMEGPEGSEAEPDGPALLEKEAHEDPGVQLAKRILGGEIVAVRPDRGHQ